MIELFEQQLQQQSRHSSKGNQLKWESGGVWYKADYTGYEGLSEFVVSRLLTHSNLTPEEFVRYETEEIRYREQLLLGAKSPSFLTGDWQIITLERLFQQQFGQSLHRALWLLPDEESRLRFLVDQTRRITGLTDFGAYLTKLLTLDAFFLNEDRHTHNIAVLMNGRGEFRLCPIFDNGAALLADTRLDYPLSGDWQTQMKRVQAKTISTDFDEQLNAAESLYGRQLWFTFGKKEVEAVLSDAALYPQPERQRVENILHHQMRKYAYLFR